MYGIQKGEKSFTLTTAKPGLAYSQHKFIKELRLLGNKLANQPKLIRRKTRWLKAEMGCEYFFSLDWCSLTFRMREVQLKLWMNWLAVVEHGLLRQYRILGAIDIMKFMLILLHWPQRTLIEKTGESWEKVPAGTHCQRRRAATTRKVWSFA